MSNTPFLDADQELTKHVNAIKEHIQTDDGDTDLEKSLKYIIEELESGLDSADWCSSYR